MKFSVIIPVYNRENCIANAIQSVINMDYSDWEMIIVDDCSSDKTNLICSKYAEKDNRIQVIRHDVNKGVSAARNTAIKMCRGGYLIFLDSDDILEKSMFCKLDKAIESHRDADIIAFGYRNSRGIGWIPSSDLINKDLDVVYVRKYILPEHLGILPQKYFLKPFVWNKCFKYGLIRDNNIFFDESRKTWEDNAFFVKCLDKSENMVCIDNIFYNIGFDDNKDHLSQIRNEYMLWDYIRSYEDDTMNYGKEYDFYNSYTCYQNFNTTIYDICYSLIKQYDEQKCIEILKKYCESETVQSWVRNINVSDRVERKICTFIKKKNSIRLYRLISGKDKGEIIYGWLYRIKKTVIKVYKHNFLI